MGTDGERRGAGRGGRKGRTDTEVEGRGRERKKSEKWPKAEQKRR